MKLSIISTASTLLSTIVYAAEETLDTFTLFGAQGSTGATPNYTQSIVVGSDPVHISKFFSFPLYLSLPDNPTDLTMATNLKCQQQIRWSSCPLKTLCYLSITTVLS